jgi:hypothetical protein
MDQPSREAVAGKLQIYANKGTPAALHQSPDGQELIPTVMHLLAFAPLRLCVRFSSLLFFALFVPFRGY